MSRGAQAAGAACYARARGAAAATTGAIDTRCSADPTWQGRARLRQIAKRFRRNARTLLHICNPDVPITPDYQNRTAIGRPNLQSPPPTPSPPPQMPPPPPALVLMCWRQQQGCAFSSQHWVPTLEHFTAPQNNVTINECAGQRQPRPPLHPPSQHILRKHG